MAISNKLTKPIDLKRWEQICFNTYSSATGGCSVEGEYSPYFPDNDLYFATPSNSSMLRYSTNENAFTLLPNQTVASNGVTAGAAAETSEYAWINGVSLFTATGGTTQTIATSLTLSQNAVGKKIRISEGTNAGNEYTIAWNTIGANATIAIVETAPLAFTISTKFYLMTGSFMLLCPSSAAIQLAQYDIITNNWYLRTGTMPTNYINTDVRLFNSHNATQFFASGAITAATTTGATLAGITGVGTNYNNYEIEIVGGTGAGQVRRISAYAAGVITTATAWTIAPDTTSTYQIKGDRTALWLCGGGTVAVQKYDMSTSTWTLLVPTVARSYIPTGGTGWDLIKDAQEWNIPNVQTGKIGGQNGRFVFSIRGSYTNTMADVYDIALNTWYNATQPIGGQESTAGGTYFVSDGKYIYYHMYNQGRYYRYNAVTNFIESFNYSLSPMGSAVYGNKLWIVKYKNGSDVLTWLYTQLPSTQAIQRMLVL